MEAILVELLLKFRLVSIVTRLFTYVTERQFVSDVLLVDLGDTLLGLFSLLESNIDLAST